MPKLSRNACVLGILSGCGGRSETAMHEGSITLGSGVVMPCLEWI